MLLLSLRKSTHSQTERLKGLKKRKRGVTWDKPQRPWPHLVSGPLPLVSLPAVAPPPAALSGHPAGDAGPCARPGPSRCPGLWMAAVRQEDHMALGDPAQAAVVA